MLFISGCAEDTQDDETGPVEEERATPVEGATPTINETSVEGTDDNATAEVTESAGENSGEGLILGQEETSLIGEEEGIIPGEEEPGQGNATFVENQIPDNSQTIVQAAEGAGYTTFASLVRDAGLEDTLNKGGPYTVFAPTDMAFESLPEGMLDDLRNDKEELNRVLTYHVVDGEYMASSLENTDSASSLETGDLTVSTTTGGQVMVGSATVVEPDINAGNGIIHGIDKVLIPPEV